MSCRKLKRQCSIDTTYSRRSSLLRVRATPKELPVGLLKGWVCRKIKLLAT